jgi:hypothetical protein
MRKYPDVSQILARKALGRKFLERLPVAEKIKISETLSKAARHARSNAKVIEKQPGKPPSKVNKT